MFTGLIEEVGSVTALERLGSSARLTVSASFTPADVKLGDSIAVNGICLTVVKILRGGFVFDVSPETLERTAFRRLAPGSAVNLERALRLSDRLGGHLVTGHVDCIATAKEREMVGGNILFTFSLPPRFVRYLVEKGSVAIDGVSLTVNSVGTDFFTVNIIPHTGAKTCLNGRRPGEEVNIEADILGKYVERFLSSGRDSSTGVSLELLARNGFL